MTKRKIMATKQAKIEHRAFSKPIEVDHYYTTKELYELRCFPWIGKGKESGDAKKDERRVRVAYLNFIKQQLASGNTLKVVEVNDASKNKYLVRGDDLLRYVSERLNLE
jgi:hypothetical protein